MVNNGRDETFSRQIPRSLPSTVFLDSISAQDTLSTFDSNEKPYTSTTRVKLPSVKTTGALCPWIPHSITLHCDSRCAFIPSKKTLHMPWPLQAWLSVSDCVKKHTETHQQTEETSHMAMEGTSSTCTGYSTSEGWYPRQFDPLMPLLIRCLPTTASRAGANITSITRDIRSRHTMAHPQPRHTPILSSDISTNPYRPQIHSPYTPRCF